MPILSTLLRYQRLLSLLLYNLGQQHEITAEKNKYALDVSFTRFDSVWPVTISITNKLLSNCSTQGCAHDSGNQMRLVAFTCLPKVQGCHIILNVFLMTFLAGRLIGV